MTTLRRILLRIPRLVAGTHAAAPDVPQFLSMLGGLVQHGANEFGIAPTSLPRFDIRITTNESLPAPQLVLQCSEHPRRASEPDIVVDLACCDPRRTIAGTDECELDLSDVMAKLDGHLTGLDHIGINVGVDLLGLRPEQHPLLVQLARSGSAVAHPGHPNWIFLMPVTPAVGGSPSFDLPMFEVVLEPPGLHGPVFQFDVRTSLHRADAERLFPAPLGRAPAGLDDVYRSVFVRTAWPTGVRLRVDVRFDRAGSASLARWLLAKGQPFHDPASAIALAGNGETPRD